MQLPHYPRYESYKPSGVEWLGDVPEDWQVSPGRACLYENKDKNTGMQESTVLSLSYGNVIVKPEEKLTGLVPESFETYQIVEPGDIIIRGTDLQNDVTSLRTGLAKNRGIITSAYINLRPHDNVLPFYLHYVLHSYDVKKVFYGLGSGLRQNLSYEDFKYLFLPLPDITTQERIVAFLDDKTDKIDRAVKIKERQIALLRERKQIIIQEAVTKGLNPDAPMKDSGIDWIGQIPAHWETLSLKYIVRLSSGDGISAERFTEEGYPVFGGNGFRGFTDRYTNNGHHVLIGRQGALCGNVNYAKGKFFASEHAIVAYPLKAVDVHWIGELIRCADFNRLSQSAAQPGISVEVISNEMFPYAPFAEQQEISNQIQLESDKINKAINVKERQIEALKEYKATLINAAVTGKIKVI